MNESKRGLGSDLAKVDAHAIQPEEYEDIPEITDEMMAQGTVMENGRPARRGRPPSAQTKSPTTLRLDADVLAHFKATGPGWQTRINEALRRVAGLS